MIIKNVKELTDKEYEACYELNLATGGQMRGQLIDCKNTGLGQAFMLLEENELVSWALVFSTVFYDLKRAFFYTRGEVRGKGHALYIAKVIKTHIGDVTVYPWNYGSDKFFHKTGFTRNYAFWKFEEQRYVT